MNWFFWLKDKIDCDPGFWAHLARFLINFSGGFLFWVLGILAILGSIAAAIAAVFYTVWGWTIYITTPAVNYLFPMEDMPFDNRVGISILSIVSAGILLACAVDTWKRTDYRTMTYRGPHVS